MSGKSANQKREAWRRILSALSYFGVILAAIWALIGIGIIRTGLREGASFTANPEIFFQVFAYWIVPLIVSLLLATSTRAGMRNGSFEFSLLLALGAFLCAPIIYILGFIGLVSL